jgi:cation diffusion facilitator family transporter
MDKTLRLAIGSIVVGISVLGLKYAAYLLTGSVALYSDALESIINVATAVTTFLAVRLSATPPDANHPFGHQKVEYLSAVLIGVLIVIAALSILRESYFAFFDPKPLEEPVEGLAVNALASVINGAWCFALFRFGRLWRSPALLADGEHLLTDVVTSVGVLVGVTLVAVTGWLVLDPAIASLVALNILWAGWKLMRKSVGGLMDEAAPEKMLTRIREGDCQGGRRGAGGTRFAHAPCRPRHLHPVPSGGAWGYQRLRCPRYLRPDRGGAERGFPRRYDHDSCRAGKQGEAPRRRARVRPVLTLRISRARSGNHLRIRRSAGGSKSSCQAGFG